MYQAGGTIKLLLDRVADKKYILPAIQREFVWKPEQICNLFDSLLQGYPFGTFLLWTIKSENRNKYQFYDFVQNYHQRDNPHCPNLKTLPEGEFVAVLDGQQRITALNIGLRGSYAWKISGKWRTSNDAFPERKLYLNLIGSPDLESGTRYVFEFLTPESANKQTKSQIWLRVGRVLEESEDSLIDELDEYELEKEVLQIAKNQIRHLYRTIHYGDKISYYQEEEQSLERVLNIFIRMNSGGTQLSYSDLLLSIAVAQWTKLDARESIHALVDEMNDEGNGFNFSKDLVLKAGLMLSDIGSVGFKVENFNKANMAKLEENWQRIQDALMLTTRLFASFGFNGHNLGADSAILPIAYYFYFRKLDEKYLSKSEYANDREVMRRWLIRSLLKVSGIWGSGLDTLLTSIRNTLQQYGSQKFPAEELENTMAARGKALRFEDEEIQELSQLDYGNKRTFALLSIIFPGFDFSHHFHVDHIYPKSSFSRSKLRKFGIDESQLDQWISMSNQLPNLQLLEGSINNEKRQKMPHEWYATQWPNPEARKAHLQVQAINELPESLFDFLDFYNNRKEILESRIRSVLNEQK